MINFTLEPEAVAELERQGADPYFEPEPYWGDYGNGLMAENSMCREYPDPES